MRAHDLLLLLILFGGGKLLGSQLQRMRMPRLIADIALGVLLANIPIFHHNQLLSMLGELGVILLLFEVGLHTSFKELLSVGKQSSLVAIGGVLAPFVCAYLFGRTQSYDHTTICYIGLILSATSVGITASIFEEFSLLQSLEARIVLGAAVIDDLLGLLLLAMFNSSPSAIITNLSLFIIFVIILWWLLGRYRAQLDVSWLLGGCFGITFIAMSVGLASIVGAFSAGLLLRKHSSQQVSEQISNIRNFLLPMFFMHIGIGLSGGGLFSMLTFWLLLIACISKLLSAWLLLPCHVRMDRLIVGVGMVPRGEVGLVVLEIANRAHVLTNSLYNGLLGAIIMSSIITPIVMPWLLNRKQKNISSR